MTCDEFQAAYLAGDEDDATRLHLSGCVACRTSLASLDSGRLTIAEPAVWEEPSPDLGEQVVMLLQGTAHPPTHTTWPRRTMAGVAAVAAAILLSPPSSPHAATLPTGRSISPAPTKPPSPWAPSMAGRHQTAPAWC